MRVIGVLDLKGGVVVRGVAGRRHEYRPIVSPLSPQPFRASMDQQASYVIQAFALARAAGVERMSIYKMVDEYAENQTDLFGLVRNDGSIRPSFTAFQTAVRYLSEPTSAQYTGISKSRVRKNAPTL